MLRGVCVCVEVARWGSGAHMCERWGASRGSARGGMRGAEAHRDVARLKPSVSLEAKVNLTLQPRVGALQTWLGKSVSQFVEAV